MQQTPVNAGGEREGSYAPLAFRQIIGVSGAELAALAEPFASLLYAGRGQGAGSRIRFKGRRKRERERVVWGEKE